MIETILYAAIGFYGIVVLLLGLELSAVWVIALMHYEGTAYDREDMEFIGGMLRRVPLWPLYLFWVWPLRIWEQWRVYRRSA